MKRQNKWNKKVQYQLKAAILTRDYENNGNEFNTILTKLKAEVFGKEQSRKDYNALENRYQQLKNEISIISSDKNRIENELSKKINKGEKLDKKIFMIK